MCDSAASPSDMSGGRDTRRGSGSEAEASNPLVSHPLEALFDTAGSRDETSGEAPQGGSTDPADDTSKTEVSGTDVSLGASARMHHLRSGWIPEGYRADWVRLVAESAAEAASLPLVDWLGKEGLDHFFAVEPVTGIGAPAHLRVTLDPFEAEVARLRIGPTTEVGETVAVFRLARGPVLPGSGFSSSEKGQDRSRSSRGSRAFEMEVSRVERPDLLEALTHSEDEALGSEPASS